MPVTFVRYLGRAIQSADVPDFQSRIFRLTRAGGWRNLLVVAPPVADESLLAPLRELGVELAYIPRPRRNFDPATIMAAYRLCRRVQADVFQCDNIHTSPMIGAWLARVPARIWFKRSMQPVFEEMRTPTLRDRLALSVRSSCFFATGVVTVSDAVKDELIGLGIPPQRLSVLPNPVPRQRISASERTAAREQFGYKDSHVVISTTGHTVPVKGWDVLLQAFKDVYAAEPQARLLLVGGIDAAHERSHYRELSEFVAANGLGEVVSFTGGLADVVPALAATDIYTLPSRSEGNSNALNEAFGAGLPCVATRVGNAPRLIRDGESGLLVERGNPRELADRLLQLVNDPGLRRRLASGTLAPLAMPATWDEQLEMLVELYREHLKHVGGPRRQEVIV